MLNCFLTSYDGDDSSLRLNLATEQASDCRSKEAPRPLPSFRPLGRSSTFPFTLLIAYAMLMRWMLLWMRGGEDENEMIWGDNLLRERPNEMASWRGCPAGRPNNCFIAPSPSFLPPFLPSFPFRPIKGGRLPSAVVH